MIKWSYNPAIIEIIDRTWGMTSVKKAEKNKPIFREWIEFKAIFKPIPSPTYVVIFES